MKPTGTTTEPTSARCRRAPRRFAQELLGEIERLQVLVAALEAEKESLCRPGRRDPASWSRPTRPFAPWPPRLEAEMNRLHEQAISLRAENERHEKEQARLQAQLESMPAESAALLDALHRDRAAELQPRQPLRGELSPPRHPRPQGSRRHHPGDHRQPRSAPRRPASSSSMPSDADPRSSWPPSGSPPRRVRPFAWAAGPSAAPRRRARSTWPIPRDRPRRRTLEERLTACIPLVLDGKVTGAIAIFRLLPQKAGIEDVDRELFDLLATHAATALYCTSVAREAHGRRRGPREPRRGDRQPGLGRRRAAGHGPEPGDRARLPGPGPSPRLGRARAGDDDPGVLRGGLPLGPRCAGGGINHFLLPEGVPPSPRFGDSAVRMLVESVLELGARRARLRAKIFGGACVLEAFRHDSHPLGRPQRRGGARAPAGGADPGGGRGRRGRPRPQARFRRANRIRLGPGHRGQELRRRRSC